LNAGLQRKLTLISAPAGFGKSTLVTEWLDNERLDAKNETQIENRIAWLSLDEGDNDPARFLTYFIAALNQSEGIENTFGKGALTMLQSPQPPPTEAVLISLINEIAAFPDKIILILDDYHLIVAQPIHDALSFWLENIPTQIHMVIATREDPSLPLARLRARGQLTELRAADLRFTTSEAAEFLNQMMGLDLSAEDIAALETRTEGWITGLQLAAISMQGSKDADGFIKSFTGSHRYILDYLIEDVLEQRSEDVQNFLLLTAILDRFNGSLCNALTGWDSGQETLEMLERSNLFIVPLDGERQWYRYHHLFADMLRQRLRKTQQAQISKLHLRASAWYEQNGHTDEAIEHALRGGDFERAAYLIEEQVDAVWERGEHAKLWRWLEGLPIELVLSKPKLCIFQAWNQFTNGQQAAAEQSLQAAEKAINTELTTEIASIDGDQQGDPDRMKIQGRAATIRAYLAFYRGDVVKTNKYSYQALEYLPEADLPWRSTAKVALGDAYSIVGDLSSAYRVRLGALELSKAAGNIYMILVASLKLAVTMRWQGKLDQVLEICQEQWDLAVDYGLTQMMEVGWLLAIWGEVLAEMNELDEALIQTKKGLELTEQGRDIGTIGWSYICLMRVLYSMGDIPGVEEIIQKSEITAREFEVPHWISYRIAYWQPRVWLVTDRLDAASQWAIERGLNANEILTYQNHKEHTVLARILIFQMQHDEANGLLLRLLEAAEKSGHTSRAIEIQILQALSLQAQGDTDQAIISLEKALNIADVGGYFRIFVDEGPPMEGLLYEAHQRGIAPDYVRRLLGAFPTTEPEQTDAPESLAPEFKFVEPLSEREIEVLQLIAEGLTNPEIAARLYLSLNTVKVHTRNIYGKLGVNNRTSAVALARKLGILQSI
jgi:LuxR family maltose regulon positive regulatory protein